MTETVAPPLPPKIQYRYNVRRFWVGDSDSLGFGRALGSSNL